MKLYKHIIFLFILIFSMASAKVLPEYKMVDLGLFETDFSRALTINEKGQVLGICKIGNLEYIFLWESNNGLKFIDMPEGSSFWDLKLNNKGQIVGVSCLESLNKAFFWDPNLGFWELETSKNRISIIALNDLGQVLAQKGNSHIFLWDHGKKINLSKLFFEQLPGKWAWISAVALNNYGHVAFNAYKSKINNDNAWGTKSFIWKDNSFKMVIPEREWETSVTIKYMDDIGNLIVNLFSREGGGYNSSYFINSLESDFLPCNGCNQIRNNLPTSVDCLPSELKKDFLGNLYFSSGIQIVKLLKEEFPYYNVPNTAEILGQNSQGHVVGSIGTMFPGNHAFLAIPMIENKDND